MCNRLSAVIAKERPEGGTIMIPANVEVYVGHPIQYGSERRALEESLRVLGRAKLSAVVVANVHIGGRQVDLVVGTENRLVVIEAKEFSRAVRGTENGPWELETAGGDWKEVTNPYEQALEAKFAIRDAMSGWGPQQAPYPAGAVVFVRRKPDGSETCPGDFKVTMVDLGNLDDVILAARQNWTEARVQLRRLAVDRGCRSVSSMAEASDPVVAEDGQLMARYEQALARTYGPGEKLVPFDCQDRNGKAMQSLAVYRRVAAGEQDALVLGGSGRGKTMLAWACAVEFVRSGGVALIVPVRNYEGNLRKVLDREAALLDMPSAARLLKARRRLSRPVLLVVDGYNECAETLRSGLTRSVAALARKCDARVLVTSRVPLARGELLALETIDVPPTSLEVKRAIVREVLGVRDIPKSMELLLRSVCSGLEARVVAEVGLEVPPDAGRFRLFDAFARRRLGDLASVAIRAATTIADWLADRISFSVSVRDLDRIQASEGIDDGAVARLEHGGFLSRRGDRVAFAHESFLDGFVAEAAVRACGGSVDRLIDAIGSPANAERMDLIIGAIDDDALLTRFLARIDNPEAIRACLSGGCGAPALEWAEGRCRDILGRVRDEAKAVRFARVGTGYVGAEFDRATLVAWNDSDRAFLAVLPGMIWRGNHLETMLEAVGTMDRRLSEEQDRIRRETDGQTDALEDQLFARTYVFGSGGPGISMICFALHSGVASIMEQGAPVPLERLRRLVATHGNGDNLSAGQRLLVLLLSRWKEIFDGFVARSIRTGWSTAPYNLRLRLLEAAQLAAPKTEASRQELRHVLESLPNPGSALGSSLLEALRSLGGLEEVEDDHREAARKEVAWCLDDRSGAQAADAWRLYVCQFDHPFEIAYWEAIHQLAEDDQKKLMAMAAEGAEIGSFLVDTLLVSLCWFGDAKLCGSLSRFLKPPPTDVWAPLDAVSAFVTAYIGLAWLGCRLPRGDEPSDSRESALGACGSLLYWSNRMDVDNESRVRECGKRLRVLDSPSQDCALDAIRMCQMADSPRKLSRPGESQVVWSIAKEYGRELIGLCRRALRRPEAQKGCFEHFSEDEKRSCLILAMDVLGRNGNSVDAAMLREFAPDPVLGRSAIAALRVLEKRG